MITPLEKKTQIQTQHKSTIFVYHTVKRLLDIILSVAGLIISSPLIVVSGIAIKIDSPGPCFYKQVRMGRDGKLFTIYKLRSMYMDAEKDGPKWADKDDSRVTKVGRVIRRFRADELPQLFNVLKGEMSIVGPRPERPYFMEKFSKEIPGYMDRLKAKCGVTGWAQVNGGYDITPEEKLEKDLYYINNQSLLLDIKIILKTIKIVFMGKGSR
jgi:exopolysaccharide biosynthesis polyprenyl glycosylphosphotransferase